MFYKNGENYEVEMINKIKEGLEKCYINGNRYERNFKLAKKMEKEK